MNQKNKRFKLSTILSLLILIGIIPITIFIVTYFSIQTKKHAEFAIKKTTKNYYEEKKEYLKEIVNNIKSIVRESDFSVLQDARKTVRSKVYTAYHIVNRIYQINKRNKKVGEIKRKIISILEGMDSLLLITRGRNINGKIKKEELQRILDTIKIEGEGFFSYTLPNGKKVGFVKMYQPLDLAICITTDLKRIEKEAKERVIEQISNMRFGKEKNNYFFIMKLEFNRDGTYYARMLLNPNKTNLKRGQIIPNDLKDSRGKLFHKEILDKCVKKGEGFVRYHFRKINSNIVEEKISYVTLYKNWNWIIGAGIYTDELKPTIQEIRENFDEHIKKAILISSGLTIFLTLLLLYLLNRLSKRLEKEIYTFKGFFKEAALANKKIQVEKIKLQEPYELAQLANKMVEDKITYEHEILNEKERLYTTIQSIEDGVIAIDKEGKITVFNRVAENLTEWNKREAIGKPIDEVFNISDGNEKEKSKGEIHSVIERGEIISMGQNTILIGKRGKKTNIEGTCTPIFDSSGKIIGGVVVFTDITEKKETEEKFRQMDRLHSIGILAGGIAHDFNNILTGILGNLTLLNTIVREKEARGYINQAREAVKRATTLTQQLLTFAKGGKPIKELASLPIIIETSTKFILSGTNIDYQLDIQEGLWDAEIDKGQFSQVIQNMVLNARHAMPKGGKIFITCRNIAPEEAVNLKLPRRDRYVEIAITDEGIGISKENLNRIFDPYFTTKDNGTGLGLAICYSIIKNHEGTITVKSEEGKGTTFFIYLPAAEKNADKDRKEKKSIELGTGKGKVIVMDDDEIIREIAEIMLKKLGFEPILAEKGERAVEIYREAMARGEPIKVVIVDITVRGGMGGEETVKELLKLDPKVKVIVSSGYSNNPIMSNYREYGFRAVVKKPFEIEDLAEAIEKVLKEN